MHTYIYVCVYVCVRKNIHYVRLSLIILCQPLASMRWGWRSWPYPFHPSESGVPWSSDKLKFCFSYIIMMFDILYIFPGVTALDTVRYNPMSNYDNIIVEIMIHSWAFKGVGRSAVNLEYVPWPKLITISINLCRKMCALLFIASPSESPVRHNSHSNWLIFCYLTWPGLEGIVNCIIGRYNIVLLLCNYYKFLHIL